MLAKWMHRDRPAGPVYFTDVYYSYGGGMSGGNTSGHLYLKNSSWVYDYSSKPTWNSKETKKVYHPGEEIIKQLEEIIRKYGLVEASKKPQSDLIALDADTASLSVTLEDGTSFRLYDFQDLDEHESEGYREFLKVLREIVK